MDKATIFSKLTHSFTADVDAMVSGPGGGKVNSITSQPVNPVPFMLLSPTVNTNGRPQFVLLGTIRGICEIHSSSNLMQWTAVSTNTLTSTTLLWLDTNAPRLGSSDSTAPGAGGEDAPPQRQQNILLPRRAFA